MATDTTVNNLIINKLTKAQYDAIASPSETELYLVPDEVDSTPTSGSDNPVASGGVYTALAGKADASSLATVATSGSYNDLSNKPTIPTIPANVSAFTNDAGYLTSHQSLSGYATEAWVGQQGYLTQHQSLSNYVQKSNTSGLLKNDGTVDTSTYLTSHQTLKTINSQSLVGSGNISIPSGTTDTALTSNEIDTIWNNVMS